MNQQFTGKVAIVTGGGTGIGEEIAVQFAEQGAKVVILGRKKASLQAVADRHPAISYQVADVSVSEDLIKVVQYIKEQFGRLDIVVNNAGMAPVTPLENQTMDEVNQVFGVNVYGVIDLSRQTVPLLKESQGTIINIGSAVAANPPANMSLYAASKAAVVTLTKVWAKELAPYGIRVNSLSVGPIWTPIYEKTKLTEAEKKVHEENIQRMVPLGRFGTINEVAAVVTFLASADASYVTGADYAVDGGFGI